MFKVPIGLKHHLLTHTGELPFLCLHCWRSFASHIDLKLHLRREHLTHLNDSLTPATPPSAKKKKETKAETVQLVMTDENGQQHFASGETQTIILGADGTIMNHNNQVGQKYTKIMIIMITVKQYECTKIRKRELLIINLGKVQLFFLDFKTLGFERPWPSKCNLSGKYIQYKSKII